MSHNDETGLTIEAEGPLPDTTCPSCQSEGTIIHQVVPAFDRRRFTCVRTDCEFSMPIDGTEDPTLSAYLHHALARSRRSEEVQPEPQPLRGTIYAVPHELIGRLFQDLGDRNERDRDERLKEWEERDHDIQIDIMFASDPPFNETFLVGPGGWSIEEGDESGHGHGFNREMVIRQGYEKYLGLPRTVIPMSSILYYSVNPVPRTYRSESEKA